HLSSLAFRRSPLALAPDARLRAAIGYLREAERAARFVFLVELARRLRRSALPGKSPDLDQPLVLADADREPVAGREHLRCLHPLAVHLHLAASNGRLGEPARLEEAGGPEPFVDAHGVPEG